VTRYADYADRGPFPAVGAEEPGEPGERPAIVGARAFASLVPLSSAGRSPLVAEEHMTAPLGDRAIAECPACGCPGPHAAARSRTRGLRPHLASRPLLVCDYCSVCFRERATPTTVRAVKTTINRLWRRLARALGLDRTRT